MSETKCIICGEDAFADDLPMCYGCAETVIMADDVFPPETHATIKPIASRIWDIVCPDIDGEDGGSDYDVCPQCGGNVMVKTNSDGSVIESICADCSYYSVDVE